MPELPTVREAAAGLLLYALVALLALALLVLGNDAGLVVPQFPYP